MVAQLSPLGRQSEIFALWGFALRLSAILGPVFYGLIVWLTEGQQRMALAFVGVFFYDRTRAFVEDRYATWCQCRDGERFF